MSAAIVVRDVTRHYRRPRTSLRHKGTAVEAVRGVSFEVEGGERFGIVGANGMALGERRDPGVARCGVQLLQER